jgi:hypothetical protein
MDQYPYLRIRYPREQGTSQVTLSVPHGVERAIKQGRVPETAEALVLDLGTWVPLSHHPVVVALAPVPDDAFVLLDPDQVTQTEEYAQFREQRAVRSSSRVRISEPARVMVAGSDPDEASDPGISRWRRHLLAVQRWAAAL